MRFHLKNLFQRQNVDSRLRGNGAAAQRQQDAIVTGGNIESPAAKSSDRTGHREAAYFTASSSTSKISVAFGGMTPPAPREP